MTSAANDFTVAKQAESTAVWLQEYKSSITPSNAKKLENRLARNKDKCPSEGYKLIYFDGDKNISLFAKDTGNGDEVSGVGFYGLAMKFSHVFDSLHSLVFFFYSIKKYWELELEGEQRERNRIKELSMLQIKKGKKFEDGSVIQDTWGNFVVNIQRADGELEDSKRLCLINDSLYIESNGGYSKLID